MIDFLSSLFEGWVGGGRRTDRILEGLREPMWKSGGDANEIRRAVLGEAIKRIEAEADAEGFCDPIAILLKMREESQTK